MLSSARRSIAVATLLRMALRVSLIVCVGTTLAYLHMKATLTERTKLMLRDYVTERSQREGLIFQYAEDDMKSLKAAALEALNQPDRLQAAARFDRYFEVKADGTLRSKHPIDLQRDPTVYGGVGIQLNEEVKSRLVLLHELTKSYGLAWSNRFIDTYFTTPENFMTLYWKGLDWGGSAASDLDMRKEEYCWVADIQHNPKREPAWTGVYYDATAKQNMVSIEQPIDIDGKHVATAGHDILLGELLERAVKVHLPGAKNLVFRGDGRLIAHPDYMDVIEKSGGSLRVNELKDDYMARLVDAAKRAERDEIVIESPGGAEYLGISRLASNGWYFVTSYPKALITSEALRAAQTILALGVLTLIAELSALYFVMRKQIAAPLQSLTLATEHVAAGEFGYEIAMARNDELGRLADSFNSMSRAVKLRDAELASHAEQLEATVATRTSELQASTRAMRMILDNVAQALITVDRAGIIVGEQSAMLEKWFGRCEPGSALADLFCRLDPAAGEWVRLGIEQLGEDCMPTEVVLNQFPLQLVCNGRLLGVQYRAIGPIARPEQLLVVVSDITQEHELRTIEQRQKEIVEVFKHLSVDPAGFLDFVTEGDLIVEGISSPRSLVELKRGLHTLKGNSAIFGLYALASICHQLEQSLADGASALNAKDRELICSAWKGLHVDLDSFLENRRAKGVSIDDREYETILSEVLKGADSQQLSARIRAWRLEPVSIRLKRLAEQANALATRLGKPALEVSVDAGGVRLDAARWTSFWAALPHVVRNAVDHGLDSASERQLGGKLGKASLSLTCFVTGPHLFVVVKDDGRGIDWPSIATKAERLGLAHASHNELVECLFADGLSTKEQVSEISGRGIGLSCVREECLARGGSVTVESSAGKGASFEFRFPLDAIGSWHVETWAAVA